MNILMSTSHDEPGDTGHKPGLWWEKFAARCCDWLAGHLAAARQAILRGAGRAATPTCQPSAWAHDAPDT